MGMEREQATANENTSIEQVIHEETERKTRF